MRRRFVVACVFLLLFALGWWAGRGRASGTLYAQLDTFVEVLHKVEENYVEPVDPAHLIGGAVQGMLRGLDPESEYLDARALSARRETHADGDIGVVLGERENLPAVVAPQAGGPSAKAGLAPQDLLLQVDGSSTSGWTIAETADRLRGARGTTVRLSVLRRGEDTPREFKIQREAARPAPAPDAYVIEKGIGVLRLSAIGDSTAQQLAPLLRKLREQGATRLVLDLRSTLGGSARAGADVAQFWIARGTKLATVKSRAAQTPLTATRSDALTQWPVVVLVDGGTSAGAEVVGGAMQDLDRALLVGRGTTFGLGSQRTGYPLNGGAARLELTTAVTLTPSGRPIARLPDASADEEDDSAPDSAAADSSSHKAFHTLSGRTVYGGGITPDVVIADSTSAPNVPSDRAALAHDPVFQKALDVLRRSPKPRDVFASLSAAGSGAAKR
jgi:carboxyl-terminal processing protease